MPEAHCNPSLRLACPAKVNLALAVAAPRPDGLHPIASWMVALDFADDLALERLDRDDRATATDAAPRFDVAFAPDAPAPREVDWPIENDLACRAHGALESHLGRPLPVAVTLRKRIPTGAGLGGGSSDAAAVLVGLDRLFQLNLGRDALTALAGTLGSDVAFLVDAMLGRPSALVTDTGGELEPAPLREPLHLTLVLPGFGCPTGPVYAAFDRLHPDAPPRPDVERVRRLTGRHPLPPEALFNDLEAPAAAVRGELAALLLSLRDEMRLPARVTGSGSASFVIRPTRGDAEATARAVTQRLGVPAIAASTPAPATPRDEAAGRS